MVCLCKQGSFLASPQHRRLLACTICFPNIAVRRRAAAGRMALAGSAVECSNLSPERLWQKIEEVYDRAQQVRCTRMLPGVAQCRWVGQTPLSVFLEKHADACRTSVV